MYLPQPGVTTCSLEELPMLGGQEIKVSTGEGEGPHLPPACATVLAEVRAWLAGRQFQQLRPLPLPFLLGVQQP